MIIPLLGSQAATHVEPVHHATCVRYYSLEGDASPDELRRAVAELSSPQAEARILAGPSGVSSRPKAKFLALELPTATTEKEVQAALRKASRKTVELAWTAFQGEDRQLPEILGFSGLECVVGMDNDMRWFDLESGRARFFYLPGKLDEEELRKRFTSLYKPFDAEELGEIADAVIEWKLSEPPGAPAVKSALRAVRKLPGIRDAEIDAPALVFRARVVCDGLRGSVPVSAGSATASRLPGGGYLADDLLAILETASIAVDGVNRTVGK